MPDKCAWTLLGKSRVVDVAIATYWKVIPEHLRQKLPDGLKMRVKRGLGNSLRRRYG